MIDHPLAASAALSSVAAVVYSYLVKSYGDSEWVERCIEEDFIPWMIWMQPETIRRDAFRFISLYAQSIEIGQNYSDNRANDIGSKHEMQACSRFFRCMGLI